MIKSMTGFGRGIASNDNYSITVELKSVNHRFLEVYIRSPRMLNQFDDQLKKQLQSFFNRGKVDVHVSLDYLSTKNSSVKVDKELATAYYESLSELATLCDLPQEISLHKLALLPGVLTVESVEDNVDELAELLGEAMQEAAQNMLQMRQVEGASLADDLTKRLECIRKHKMAVAAYAPRVTAEQKQRLSQRISDLLGEVELDQAKLANEIAFFADKVDISEELTRMESHLVQFRQAISSDISIGRKMEFILQELLRETNTIGSKSNALEINDIVIEIKSELEKIREQIQNIE